MKISEEKAATLRSVLRDYFSGLPRDVSSIACPNCDGDLGIEGWSEQRTSSLRREQWDCSSCGTRWLLREDWLQ